MKFGYVNASKELQADAAQWQVYESTGHCVVLAGPGSGKTKTLTIKLARMLREDVRAPRGIACITYSVECAREIKKRLDALGTPRSSNLFVGTIHSFCLQHIVRPYLHIAEQRPYSEINIKLDTEMQAIYRRAFQNCGVNEQLYRPQQVDNFRRRHFDSSSKERRQLDPDLDAVASEVEHLLLTEHSLDFEAMVLRGWQLVTTYPWILRALNAKFPIIIVDEYQDLGRPLDRIVRALCFSGSSRLLAVGDPDQSIYGFNEADPNLLIDLAKEPTVECIKLVNNYRSAQRIIDSSITILGEDRNYKAKSPSEGAISIIKCPDGQSEQIERIFGDIIPQCVSTGAARSLGDIAILYFDKYDIAPLVEGAKRHSIGYVRGGRETEYRRTALIRWLEDCASWCSGGWKQNTPRLEDLLQFWLDFNLTRDTAQEAIDRQILVKFLLSNRSADSLMRQWLFDINKELLANACAAHPERAEDIDALRLLFTASQDVEKLANSTLSDFGQRRGSKNHINLITLHSSKGLEFDVVLIPNCEEGRLPSYRVRTEREQKEARRLFYVAITRARNSVYILYSGWYKSYGRIYSTGPSRFIQELDPSASRNSLAAALEALSKEELG